VSNTQATTTRRPLILIVDPDETARDLYGHWCISHGFDVMSAAAVDGACWAARRQRPDAVVTELALRRSSGVELIHALHRTNEVPIPVLVVTSSMDGTWLAAARTAGALAIFPKLMEFQELGRWLRALTSE
jgi:DNA-binding response OmpR family regulator